MAPTIPVAVAVAAESAAAAAAATQVKAAAQAGKAGIAVITAHLVNPPVSYSQEAWP